MWNSRVDSGYSADFDGTTTDSETDLLSPQSTSAFPRRGLPHRKRIALAMIVVGLIAVFIGVSGLARAPVNDEVTLEFHRTAINNASFDVAGYEENLREVVKQQHSFTEHGGQDWMTQTFERDKVAEFVDYVDCHGHGKKASNIPTDFGGLWWMDGNPAPEDVSSFGEGVWTPGLQGCRSSKVYFLSDEEKKKGVIKDYFGNEVPCRGRLDMDYYDERTWTWPVWPLTPGVREANRLVRLGAFRIEFVCGGKDRDFLTICKVAVPTPAAKYMAKVFPTDYYMVRVSKSQWIRYTPTHFGLHQYYLKQIIDCGGHKVEPHWHQFNSNGWDKTEFQRDVFGRGGDTRRHVQTVAKTQYVRVNMAAAHCPKRTGSCSWFKSCDKNSHAVCQEGVCFCGEKGQCERNGRCT